MICGHTYSVGDRPNGEEEGGGRVWDDTQSDL